MESTLKPVLSILAFLPVFSFLILAPVSKWTYASGASDPPTKEEWKAETDQAIEKYEKEKLIKLRRQIGRRFMAVGVDHALVFYESPDDLEKKTLFKGKEPIRIAEVVRNRPGTMYFYKVRFESGKVSYLSAEGLGLDLRIREGRLIPLARPKLTKKPDSQKTRNLHGIRMASEAVKMVKNHPTGKDPITGERSAIEKRMVEAKKRSFPGLKWRYEAKGIGNRRYRVTQFVEGGPEPRMTRTWIVDLHSGKVTPENAAAKRLY